MVCKIETFSTFFRVSSINPLLYRAINDFMKSLVEHELEKKGRKFRKVAKRVYAYKCEAKEQYHFHINLMQGFLDCLKKHGINLNKINYVKKRTPCGAKVKFKFGPKRPRVNDDIDQNSVISTFLEEGPIKVGALSMGGGKTFCSSYAANLTGERLGIQVMSRFKEKWIGDVYDLFDIEDSTELLVIDSGDKLRKTLEDAYKGSSDIIDKSKIVILTTGVLISYIKDWAKHGGMKKPKWMVEPYRIWEVLEIGFRVIDEVHMSFHQNYLVDINCNVKKNISLSATLVSKSAFRKGLYKICYPYEDRTTGGFKPKYTHLNSILYPLDPKTKVSHTSANGGYSHVMFENSIMGNKKVLERYLDMIEFYTNRDYVELREEGTKNLIFCSKVDMCDLVVERLRTVHPDLEICRYTSDDEYEDILKSDIIVSTLGSAGTALDIPMLINCIMTVALSAPQANLQAFGRLRDLKDAYKGMVKFSYFTCYNIQKHKDYDKDKRELLNSKTKKFSMEYYGVSI